MTEFEAVLFDMDGVLVDTEPHWHDLWREHVFPEAGGDPSLDDVTGRSYAESLRDLEAEYGLERDVASYEERLAERAESLYVSEADGPAGVHELFDELRDRGVRVGIVSSSPRPWIEGVVERFDLGPLDALVSAVDAAGPGKPAPDVYEAAAAELGVAPAACLVVEDSENGVRAAAAAGATVVQFSIGDAELRAPAADVRASDPDGLRAALLGLLEGDEPASGG